MRQYLEVVIPVKQCFKNRVLNKLASLLTAFQRCVVPGIKVCGQ